MSPDEPTGPPPVDFAAVLAAHPRDGWVVVRAVRDADGAVVDFVHEWSNATADRNSGVPLAGTSMLEVFGAENVPLFPVEVELLARGGTADVRFSYDEPGHDASLRGRTFEVHLHALDADRLVAQYRDVTELVVAQRVLETEAATDELTGLPNRRRLRQVLAEALVSASPDDPVAVMVVDLDRFKAVNDTHGHDAGDEVLRQVGERMRTALRGRDEVARVGGDEFVVVCRGLDDAQAHDVADRLRLETARPFPLRDGVQVTLGATIGVAHLTAPVDAETALRAADAHLYATKAR